MGSQFGDALNPPSFVAMMVGKTLTLTVHCPPCSQIQSYCPACASTLVHIVSGRGFSHTALCLTLLLGSIRDSIKLSWGVMTIPSLLVVGFETGFRQPFWIPTWRSCFLLLEPNFLTAPPPTTTSYCRSCCHHQSS